MFSAVAIRPAAAPGRDAGESSGIASGVTGTEGKVLRVGIRTLYNKLKNFSSYEF